MKYILHNYRRCPFCIRVRILLHLHGVEYEVVEEPLRQWTGWMKDWSKNTGERARVPVLRIISGSGEEEILVESNQINLALDARLSESAYTPATDSETYSEMLTWFKWCDEIFKHQIDRFKYGENLEFDATAHIEDTKALREMVTKIEEALENMTHLLEDRLTLADIAIIPFVRQIMRTREGEFDFTDFPRTKAWTLSIVETPWFEDEVMKKYPLALTDK
jgi:glutathione S-transferase